MAQETPYGTPTAEEQASESVRFNRIYRTWVGELTRYACKFVPREEAADIVHDVFVMMWRQKKFDIPSDEVRFFLYRCTLNACKNRIKHLVRTNAFRNLDAAELQLAEIDFLEANIESTADTTVLNRVYRRIGQLPPKCREIFEQAYLHQKRSQEIADQMRISRRTVEAQLYKALKLLRQELILLAMCLIGSSDRFGAGC